MNIKETLKKVASYIYKNEFRQAEILCRKILKFKPRNYQSLHYIGLALYHQKKIDEAIHFYNKALSIKDNGTILNNLGSAYLEKRDYKNAEKYFKKSVQLSPERYEYITNLGLALHHLKNFSEAQKQYECALKLKPDYTRAMVYLGILYQNQGLLNEAIEMHLAANDLDPNYSLAYVHLFNSLFLNHVTDDALHVARAGLLHTQGQSIEKLALLIGIAKISWLSGQIEMAKDAIFKTHGITNNLTTSDKSVQNFINYHDYLSNLFTLRDNSPELYQQEAEQAIFFIGDSHCLSPSETVVTFQERNYRILSTMITGCKAYHFSRQANSEFKESLVRILRALPINSVIIIGAGEIDCRADEGIMTAHRKRGVEYTESVPKFVDQYVDFVVSVANKYNHQIIFYGVPSMSQVIKDHLSETDASLLIDIIDLFNKSLRVSVGKRNLQLLDIYSLTLNIEKKSEYNVHIDKFHVHPITLKLLFDDFLISP